MRRVLARARTALLAVAGACASACAIAATKPCHLQTLSFPVEIVASKAVATLRLNGTPMRLAVDSGAFFSSITDAAAQQLGLPLQPLPWGMRIGGLFGRMEAHLTRVKDVELAHGGVVHDVDFIVGGNEGDDHSVGLIGRNLLSSMDAEYDFAHGVVRLILPDGDCGDRNMAYWAGEQPVSELRLLRDETSAAPALRAVVKVNGEDVVALLDSGGADSSISLRAARQAGITDADLVPAGKRYGVGRGESNAWVAPIRSVEIAGETIEHNRLEVDDFDPGQFDMLLGIDFFLSHRLYVSKSQRKVFFTYNGGAIFANNHATPPAPSASDAATAVADEPGDAAAYALRGAARAGRQDLAGALADLDRACALAPLVGQYRRLRGDVEARQSHHDAAARDYDEALRLDPSDAEAHVRRAWLRLSADDRDGTLADLQALDALLPPQAGLRGQMGYLYADMDLPERALPQWSAWIAAHPHDVSLPSILNARCWSRQLANVELPAAAKDCEQALDAEPKNAEFLAGRGWLRLRRGDPATAREDFDRALAIQPASAWAQYGRGVARVRLGEDAAGRADIAAARVRDPDVEPIVVHHGLSDAGTAGHTAP